MRLNLYTNLPLDACVSRMQAKNAEVVPYYFFGCTAQDDPFGNVGHWGFSLRKQESHRPGYQYPFASGKLSTQNSGTKIEVRYPCWRYREIWVGCFGAALAFWIVMPFVLPRDHLPLSQRLLVSAIFGVVCAVALLALLSTALLLTSSRWICGKEMTEIQRFLEKEFEAR